MLDRDTLDRFLASYVVYRDLSKKLQEHLEPIAEYISQTHHALKHERLKPNPTFLYNKEYVTITWQATYWVTECDQSCDRREYDERPGFVFAQRPQHTTSCQIKQPRDRPVVVKVPTKYLFPGNVGEWLAATEKEAKQAAIDRELKQLRERQAELEEQAKAL